ncbi:MAG: phosphoribosyltransferase family protein [Patescibacteria group bacterium]|jgi:predicted phosphoribosyltransferase
MFKLFLSRAQAGDRLAAKLRRFAGPESVVISLPRGGIATGIRIADRWRLPHDLIAPRKIPEQKRQEWSVGAVTASGVAVWDNYLKNREPAGYLRRVLKEQIAEARRRERHYRLRRGPLAVAGRTVIVADDGVARGWTMLAAIEDVKAAGATRVVVAVPVISKTGLRLLRGHADAVVYLHCPRRFWAVGAYYRKGTFDAVGDDEVRRLLLDHERRVRTKRRQ